MLSNDIVKPGKTYTFSGHVKTVGLNTVTPGTFGAVFMVTSYLSDGTSQNYYSDYISSSNDTKINNGWRRESVTFTVPTNAINTSVNLVLKAANGSAYFDALQLEEGSVANDYNLLGNASFEQVDSFYGYTTTNLTLGSLDGTTQTSVEGNTGIKFTGEKDKLKQIGQEVSVAGSEEDTYIISVWAKAYSVPAYVQDGSSNINRRFKISVKVTYTDNTYVWKEAAEFNPDIVDWQYAAVAINLSDENSSTNKTPAKIGIYPRYDYQANVAIFDNLSVIKDEVPSYSYDSNGNLISVVDNATQKSTIQYSNNDLIS